MAINLETVINDQGEEVKVVKVVASTQFIFETDENGEIKRFPNGSVNRIGEIVSDGALSVQKSYRAGLLADKEGLLEGQEPDIISSDIKIGGNPLPFEFSDIGGLVGQQLGYRLAGDNVVLGVGTSALLQTVGDNLFDVVDGVIDGGGLGNSINEAFSEFGDELLTNIQSAGVGALSSFITAEIIDVIGIDGIGVELISSVANGYLSAIISNLPGLLSNTTSFGDAISGVDPFTIAGSFIGNKLANEIVQFETIGGQIGSAVGSSLGLAAAAKLGLLGGPKGLVIAAVVAVVSNIIGGLIGSLFGGTPRSGADALWDEQTGRFVAGNVYSRIVEEWEGEKERAVPSLDAHIDPRTKSEANLASRLALLRQDLAAFGNERHADDLGDARDRTYAPLDYFA